MLADHFGLVGHLAGEWGLGASVDTDDPRAFAAALGASHDRSEAERAELRRTVERLTGPQEFERALSAVFGEPGGAAVGATGAGQSA